MPTSSDSAPACSRAQPDAGAARRRATRRRLATLAATLAVVLWATPGRAALTGAAPLAGAYDSILDARFDRAEAQLGQACPPAPMEACQSMRVVSLWWRILLNPESRVDDRRFEQLATAAISANAAWTEREPRRAEAWFYLAGSYAPLVQWRILREDRLAAAREGAKIKSALERALQIDPTLDDAYFGIGLYHYYADIAPTAAKILRWLLFLPGGDRSAGLREMQQTRERGELLRGEADFQLHLIYLWYEQRTDLALDLLEQLDRRHPNNPLFRARIADAHLTYRHDAPAAAQAWRDLLARARAGTVYDAKTTETRARLGLAAALVAMNRWKDASDELDVVRAARPSSPPDANARAEQLQREIRQRTGSRD